MKPTTAAQLRSFLSDAVREGRCDLYLPRFADGTLPCSRDAAATPFHYPGYVHSDRDVRAALHIATLLSAVVDPCGVHLREAEAFLRSDGLPSSGFVFGSRSSPATTWVAEHLAKHKLFHFQFGAQWEIHWHDGRVFALPDPSQLDRETYTNSTDYGVLARCTDPESSSVVFVVAGLGGRATEGCGRYFVDHWTDLKRRFGRSDFAVLLRFDPPVCPDRCVEVTSAATS